MCLLLLLVIAMLRRRNRDPFYWDVDPLASE